MGELLLRSALEQLALLHQGEVSPLELAEAYLQRIEQIDPALGSYWTVLRESVLTQARRITDQGAIADRLQGLPLLGLPVSIKDLHALEGAPASLGIAALRERMVSYDDGAVARLRAAGCLFLGKTATAQLGTQPVTEPPGFAPTRNPWNPSRTAGGSSGGAAAALAAGLCAAAHGSDGGGSLRGPAFCCGLVGLKAARGRISNAPLGESFGGLATHGMLTRTVADAALFLDVLSGGLPGDPYALSLPEVPFLQQVQAAAGLPAQRIALVRAIAPFPPPIPELNHYALKVHRFQRD
jgi:amidase